MSSADNLISSLKEEACSNQHLNTDPDEEIEIVEEIDVKPLKSKNKTNQQHIFLPPLNEASTFIKEMAKQVRNSNVKVFYNYYLHS